MGKDELKHVYGFKAFNEDHTNRYGVLFEAGKTYKTEGTVQFGTKSMGGYHMCQNLEDTLKFFEGLPEDPVVAEVEGFGKIVKYDDETQDYFDMYSVETLKVKRFLSREEMLNLVLSDPDMYDDRVCRFLQGVRLNPAEIEIFKEQFEDSPRVLKTLAYYQENDKDVYDRDYRKFR